MFTGKLGLLAAFICLLCSSLRSPFKSLCPKQLSSPCVKTLGFRPYALRRMVCRSAHVRPYLHNPHSCFLPALGCATITSSLKALSTRSESSTTSPSPAKRWFKAVRSQNKPEPPRKTVDRRNSMSKKPSKPFSLLYTTRSYVSNSWRRPSINIEGLVTLIERKYNVTQASQLSDLLNARASLGFLQNDQIAEQNTFNQLKIEFRSLLRKSPDEAVNHCSPSKFNFLQLCLRIRSSSQFDAQHKRQTQGR